MTYYLGLDLGGTNIKAGVVDDQGTTLAKASFVTPATRDFDAVVAALDSAARVVVAQAGMSLTQVQAVGVGAPGPVDRQRGVIIGAPNFRSWINAPLRDRVQQATGRPTVVEHDASAAALAEFWVGAGKSATIEHMVMLTLGTGIGSGLVVNGRLMHGGFGVGAEGGHIIVEIDGRLCGCGQRGCLEAYASASNTARRALEALTATDQPSTLRDLPGVTSGELTCQQVFAAAENGDVLAEGIVDQTATYLGVACVTLCRLLDPQMIVFAGGMILAGDYLFDRVRSAFCKRNWELVPSKVRIVPALLGNDAGYIGAAAVARAACQSGGWEGQGGLDGPGAPGGPRAPGG